MKRKNAIEIPENSETKVTLTVDKNSIVYNENNAAYLTAYAEVHSAVLSSVSQVGQ